MAKAKQEHWSYTALRKRLAENVEIFGPSAEDSTDGEPSTRRITRTPDWQLGTIFLFDPELKHDIQATFDLLYPKITEVFDGEPFAVPSRDEIKLEEGRGSKGACCSALFILRDPTRPPLGADSPWLYVRFNLEVRVGGGYFLNTDLHLSLPFWLETEWSIDFMVGARDWGMPPTLSVSHNEFSLQFSHGAGDWLSFAEDEGDGMVKLLRPFRTHLSIAKAIDRFSSHSNNRFLRVNMLEQITTFYGAQ